MSDFRGTAQRCFSEASGILSGITSEFRNWNDSKANTVKQYIDNTRRSFQTVCNAAGKVNGDIQKMREISSRVESISRKSI